MSLCVSLLGGRALSFCFGGGAHSLFFLMMMMELYDHSLFCLGDRRLCVCYCLAVVLSLFVLVVGHDLPLSLTLSLTLCFDDKMIYFSVCVLVKNSFFVFGHSLLFW